MGIYLPVALPLNTTCERSSCDYVLANSDGLPFIWQDWMGDAFNRAAHQPRCFQVSHDDTVTRQTPHPRRCYAPASMVCSSSCPRPGVPIYPAPANVTRQNPVSPPILLARQRRRKLINITDSVSSLHHTPSSTDLPLSALADASSQISDPNFGLPKSTNPRHVVGYDCSDPLDIQPLRAQSQRHSCTIPSSPLNQRNATIAILQKSDLLRISLRQCVITETVVPYYCGVWSHGVFVHPWARFKQSVSVSQAECHSMWDKLLYVDPQNVPHKLRANATSTVFYNIAGRTVFLDDGAVACEGSTYTDSNGKPFYNMVVSAHREITLLTQPATVSQEGVIHVTRPDVFLSCSLNSEACSNTHGHFIWNRPAPDETCRYYQTRISSGIIMADQYGVDTFMSNDGSLIRLLIGDAVSTCGHVLHATNYPKLFVSLQDVHIPIFNRSLHPTDFSIYTYANQQDSWLYGYLTTYIRDEFQAVHYQSCQRRLLESNLAYDTLLAEQHGSIDGDTAALGGGWFVTTGGEAWFKHRCRRIIVSARSSSSCHASLPVSLSPSDTARFLLSRDLPPSTNISFFLEPHSRRLTTRGIAINCTRHFYGLYQGLNGNWIRSSPTLSFPDAPDILTSDAIRDLVVNRPEDFNFDEGGIYHSDDILRMETHLQSHRAIQDVSVALGRDAQAFQWTSSSSSGSPFSPAFYSNAILSFSPLGWLWDGLLQWGQFVSIIMGIVYIVKFFIWLYSCHGRLLLPIAIENAQARGNFFRHVYTAAFPPRRTSSRRPRSRSTSPPPPPMPLQSVSRSRSWDSIARARADIEELRNLVKTSTLQRRATPQGQTRDSSQHNPESVPLMFEMDNLTPAKTKTLPPPQIQTATAPDLTLPIQPRYPSLSPKPVVKHAARYSPPRRSNKHQKRSPPTPPPKPLLSQWIPPPTHHSWPQPQPNSSHSSKEELTTLQLNMSVPPPTTAHFPVLRPTSSTLHLPTTSPRISPTTQVTTTQQLHTTQGSAFAATQHLRNTQGSSFSSVTVHTRTPSPTASTIEFRTLRRQLECLITDVTNVPANLASTARHNLIFNMKTAYTHLEQAAISGQSVDHWHGQLQTFRREALLLDPSHMS